jgi:hypothetical protein
MTSYYVMRPLRDAMGIAGGTRTLPWLFTATFLVLILVQPFYGATVARLSRRQAHSIHLSFLRRQSCDLLAATASASPSRHRLCRPRVFCLGRRFQSVRSLDLLVADG